MQSNGKRTVVVVDDDRELRNLIAGELRAEGYDVRPACDGLEALSLLRALPTEDCVVVSDLQMPRMSGRALLSAIRRDLRMQNLPVLIVSSVAQRDELAEADGVLGKPFESKQLCDMVAELFAA